MSDDPIRYARHLALPEIGASGQARLAAARVLVVGCGGLGSPVALYLAAAGVGTLGLLDHDVVDLSNLQRQVLFDTADIGSPKVVAAARRLRALNPGLTVHEHRERLERSTAARLFDGYELVVDGTDRLATRYLVSDACVALGKPLVSAAIHRFEGQAFSYVPGRSPCYRCLFPDGERALVPSCAEAGVLGVLPGVMGSLQATEAIKLLLGLGTSLAGRFLLYDALALRFQEFPFTRRRDCAACGDHIDRTTLLAPEDQTMGSIERWTPAQVAAALAADDAGRYLLVDVRESYEWEDSGHAPGALLLPLGSLPQRLAELPADRRLVFMCAGGVRSLHACQFAAAQGRDTVNVEGGFYLWAVNQAVVRD
ncbi:MAG: hypothetical protein RL026_1927 [Pseudomonadota bacterium]